MKKFNIPFLFVLTGVWLILLALCALIGYLIVPVDPSINSQLLRLIISAGKVGLSLTAILIWLYGWYRTMDILLKFEFYLSEEANSTND